MRLARGILRTLLWTVTAVAILLVGGVFFLTRTDPGVRFVVGEAFERLEGGLRGSVRFDGVESTDLFDGATLLGVEVRDDSDRLVARIDTLKATYSVFGLARGDVILDDVEILGGTVIVERLPGQDEMNVRRVLSGGGSEAPEPDPAEADDDAGRTILLRNVRIARTDLRVQLPVEDRRSLPDGAFTIASPVGEGRLRHYDFREIEAHLSRAALSTPGEEGVHFQVTGLSTDAVIQREGFRVEDVRGRFSLRQSRLVGREVRIALPASRATGELTVDWSDGGTATTADLDLERLRLAELKWLLPDLPEAVATGPAGLYLGPDSTSLRFDGVRASLGGSVVRATGGVRVQPDLRFHDVSLDLDPFDAVQLDPWLEEPLPYRGMLRGEVLVDGLLSGLGLGGSVDLVDEGLGPTTVRFSGLVALEDRPGVQGFQLDVMPLDYALVRSIWPERRMEGSGSLLIEASGWFDQGMNFILDLEHEGAGSRRSRIEAGGTVRTDAEDVYLDVDGEVDPVDLRALRDLLPDLDLDGVLEGSVRLTGRLADLRVESELEAPAGTVALDARFDARDPAAGYDVTGDADDFRLSELFGFLPDPTTVSGDVRLRGSGLDMESVAGTGTLALRESRLATVVVDSARSAFRVGGGSVTVDTLRAHTNLAAITATGAFGLDRESALSRLEVEFVNDSLERARPVLFGEDLIAGDTLSPLERQVLTLEGIDPDTLPTVESMAMAGRLEGRVTLEGWLEDFSAEGSVAVRDAVYGEHFLRDVDVEFAATGLPNLDGRFEGAVASDSVRIFGRSFVGGDLTFDYSRPDGEALLELVRNETESYRARAAFDADADGGVVHLDELVLRFDPVVWNLGGPATFEWDSAAVRVRDFRLVRPGVDGMRVVADGVLPFRGPADFALEVRRLDLARLAGLAQTERQLGGMMDLDLDVSGTADSPVFTGTMAADSLRYGDVVLTRIEGDVGYHDQVLEGALEAFREGLLGARVEGDIPMDLALRDVERRLLDRPVEILAVVDSFPLAVLTSPIDPLEDVDGRISGAVRFQGTPADVEAVGSFQLHGAAFSLLDLGIRPTAIDGTVRLLEGDRLSVDLQASSLGQVRVQGDIGLTPLTDPTFDLNIAAQGFQAVNRRDLQARIGGGVRLTGSYRRPVVAGSAQVEEGVLEIEEFERSSSVVDLSDPQFFDVVDTTIVSLAPGLQVSENPFLQNLLVEVDLALQRNTWIRSRDMNVEMGGELVVNWNRTSGDLVLTGELEAIRGTYTAFGRQFQVSGGTVDFVGTPGLDPNLALQAVTRLRTTQDEPLTITAGVQGTLLEPRVTLTSDAQPPIAESDLASYLIFGRPSYVLASGEEAVLAGAAGQLLGAGASMILGVAANQLSTAAQQIIGIDYLAVTQASGGGAGVGEVLQGTVGSTQVEVGSYVTDDVFLSLHLRPLADLGTGGTGSQFAALRTEWRVGDVWTLQGFVEDRFSRGRFGFGDFGYNFSKIYGFFLYRDWGY